MLAKACRRRRGDIWKICGAVGLIAVAALVLFEHSATAADKSRAGLWNSREVRSQNLEVFDKWLSALRRYSEDSRRGNARTCRSTVTQSCPYEQWYSFLDQIRDKDKWSQIVGVNGFMNARRYITDDRNWGVKDYWETPGEFMLRSGDCEDFAIAKYLSLRDLGWENDQLRVAVVRDMNLKVTHAVLIVYYGGKAWVLDNQTNRVIETDQVRHYRPIFSINENYWWHHRPERPSFSEIATAWFAWGASPAASEPEENKTPLP